MSTTFGLHLRLAAPLLLLAAAASAAVPTSGPSPASVATAGRIAGYAQRALQQQRIEPPHLKLAVALLQAAGRLDPTDPRYPRLLMDALGSQGNDSQQALLTAVSAYRALVSDDRSAQILALHLYLAAQQTADAKLRYLREVLGNGQIHLDVRSVAAVRAAELLLDRSRDEALAMLRQALNFNPQNLEAVVREFELVHRQGSAVQRVGSYLAMLRCNPAQFGPLYAVASELADARLRDQALEWYARAAQIGQRSNVQLPRDFFIGYAVQLFLAEQPALEGLAENVVRGNAEDYGFLVLHMMHARRRGQIETANRLRMQARNVLLNQLARVRQMAGDKLATTRPVEDRPLEAPDVKDDPGLLANANDEVRQGYYQAIGELAWFNLYFDQRREEADRMIKGLAANVAETNALLVRLVGWAALADGDSATAKVKLSAVADKDPLAALGLIKILSTEQPAQAEQDAAKLLASVPSNVTGAIVADALRERNLKPAPRSDVPALVAELERFPAALWSALTNPQGTYLLKAEPLKTTHLHGEPMLVRVTLQNISQLNLTLGRDGLIRPDLWFDAHLPQFRENVPQPIVGACYDRLPQQGVLRPGETVTQIVRVDQGMLLSVLMQNPVAIISVGLTLRTNPLPLPGGVANTPGGYSVTLSKPLERIGFPARAESFQKLLSELPTADGDQKIRSLELLATFNRLYSNLPGEGNAALKADAETFTLAIRRYMDDADPLVGAWARFFYGQTLTNERQRGEVLGKLLQNPEWTGRLLGIVAASALPAEKLKQLLGPLASDDPEPLLRQLAAATLEISSLAPATQPTTQPSP